MRQGDVGHEMFFIIEGELEVNRGGGRVERDGRWGEGRGGQGRGGGGKVEGRGEGEREGEGERDRGGGKERRQCQV